MNNPNYTRGPVPVFNLLGTLKQPDGPDYTLYVLPIPGQDFYLLLREPKTGKRRQSCAYVTAESALEMLQEPHFQKTMFGIKLLAGQPLEAAPEQIDLKTLEASS